jgi:ferritin-like metal-binding protein YciE
MTLKNLKDVYIDQLQDLYSANRQAAGATQKLQTQCHDTDLKDALKRGVEGINDGIQAVERIILAHGENPTAEFCKGMQGLVKEAQAHAIDADFGDGTVRDAMIITQYQRMTHYAIAGYGCVVAFASQLGLNEEARVLRKCLDATRHGDLTLTELAEGKINLNAA